MSQDGSQLARSYSSSFAPMDDIDDEDLKFGIISIK
jgi:hypothetical protein